MTAVRSGFCQFAMHDRCPGTASDVPCDCPCHQPTPEPPAHCPTCTCPGSTPSKEDHP